MAKKKAAVKEAAKGKRYTAAQKAKVVAFVNGVNSTKGRGGVAAAKKKFGITALTISKWVKDAGGAAKPKAKKAGRGRRKSAPRKAAGRAATAGGRAKALANLGSILKEIDKKRAELASLEAKFEKAKAAL